jgi:GH15 family glucan-1,4-alpha-glucosidase
VSGTIDAVWQELGRDGVASRYSTAITDDGLPGDEGRFLACSFWLVDALARNRRVDEARYDVARGRQVGNFPQAFSHLTLILAARAISTAGAKVERGAA